MHYLALVFEAAAPPRPAAAPALHSPLQPFRLDAEALELRLDGGRLRSCAIRQSRVPGLSALLWIEARDFNEALRLAAGCPLAEDAVLELHSLERSAP